MRIALDECNHDEAYSAGQPPPPCERHRAGAPGRPTEGSRDGSRGYLLARLGGRGYQRLSRSLPATTRTGTLLASTNEEFTEIFTRLYERLEPEFAEISKLQ